MFNPKLLNVPVIVLSNNDGCTVSRSNEAKRLGIPMGEPLFKIQDLVRKHNISILSSNFSLYGDLSARVMSIISQHVPDVEIYSIDEAFLNLSNMQERYDLTEFCSNLASIIERCTGIPVSIGIAPTRTLAKIANQIAKMQGPTNKIFYLDSPEKISNALFKCKVRDVWGIGRQLECKLQAMGVNSAYELAALTEKIVKSNFNIVMWRTVQELNGNSVINLRNNTANKEQIMVSRSFGHRVTELTDLQEALATYTSMACEKLRKQCSVAGGLKVFLQTGLHGATETVYKSSNYVTLEGHCNDTRIIFRAAKEALCQMFKKGYRYQKVGIVLSDISSIENMQFDLFSYGNLAKSDELMLLIDKINSKLGKNTVEFAASGLQKSWMTNINHKSCNFIGSWGELPIANL